LTAGFTTGSQMIWTFTISVRWWSFSLGYSGQLAFASIGKLSMSPHTFSVSATKVDGSSCTKLWDLVGPSACSLALQPAMIWSPSVMPVPDTPSFVVGRTTEAVWS
jgi:hypothetical protein